MLGREPGEWATMQFPESSPMPKVYFLNHHLTHAANAFFLPSFDDAAILTAEAISRWRKVRRFLDDWRFIPWL